MNEHTGTHTWRENRETPHSASMVTKERVYQRTHTLSVMQSVTVWLGSPQDLDRMSRMQETCVKGLKHIYSP